MMSGRDTTISGATTALRNPSEDEQQDNPFAPPAENTPDRPWKPRRSEEPGGPPPAENNRWGLRLPGRQDDRSGKGPADPGSGGPRFDPTDPVQRRARYALLSGMWGVFFVILGWTALSLLLGSLALYWGISALRTPRKSPVAVDAAQAAPQKPYRTAALSGVIAGVVALLMVAGMFTVQMVYKEYFTCTQDALTSSSRDACDRLLPDPLRELMEPSDR